MYFKVFRCSIQILEMVQFKDQDFLPLAYNGHVIVNSFYFLLEIQDEFSDPDLAVMGEESKSENGENAPVYCICRKPDINCFMM